MKSHRISSVSFLWIAALLLFASCSDSSTGGSNSGLSEDQENVIQYFKDVALGFEFGNALEITRKWNEDILIFVDGEENQMLRDELDTVVSELNNLLALDDIEISTTTDSTTHFNYYLFLGPGEEYAQIEPNAQGYVESNFGLFFVNMNAANQIVSGTMYVDTNRPAPMNQRHLLREELTQSLGMAKDSDKYSDSIFNSSYSVDVTEFSEYDEAVIRLLYHPSMKAGFNASQADSVLYGIIDDVIY
ncbi:DUF2927 domain-containing protein [Rhodohalobacter sp. 614A]|uniref:DUF2927 domain-containing protein n=1 Tax=Rhodohalobacter sp. 614A TaxID=2908649 RepID=UPI001F2FAB29|nr:DUF2927 domain-containing protein [Rhodohalobacter sp. 614A]